MCFMRQLQFLERETDLQFIRGRLGAVFDRVRAEQRWDPTSQFVCAFISSRTYDEVSRRAFEHLIKRYRGWDDIADAPAGDIEAVLRNVTFSERKAPDLKLALRKIRARAGSIDLEFLAEHQVGSALFWLEQIYGVGRKIAATTLNFSTLRKRAFVVDTHVARVMRRFGFVDPKADTVAVYDAVMAAADRLDADDLFELHCHLKRLGQETCTHSRAMCISCPLSNICTKRVETGVIVVTRQSTVAA